MYSHQHHMNEEEIKNLFFFLGDEDPSLNRETLKTSNIIWGLENYGLQIPSESIRLIKQEIEKKSKNDKISLEDFKVLWTASVETKIPTKDLTNHMYNMMNDILSSSHVIKHKRENSGEFHLDKINKTMLVELLKLWLYAN